MYLNPLKGWDTVIGRFPKMQYNVEESAKCFALERYGAAVFHILQVAEYGVIQVGKLYGRTGRQALGDPASSGLENSSRHPIQNALR